ncbi:MAG: (Fe-S)-binding protein [Alphaproteobacteria bacterium]|nr:(Fe-S)-binding protein [Alphaproteobacteria bacterium]
MRVGLFATCLVDLFRPTVGFAAAQLIEATGATVEVPAAQTCCGQPAYNFGARPTAVRLAKQFIGTFEPFDYVVAPSGSCAGMVKLHFPSLLLGHGEWEPRARAVADKTHELTHFLYQVMRWPGPGRFTGRFGGQVTYHDGCAGLRELGISAQPRALLGAVDGLELVEGQEAETCCGFGGTFCVKHPGLSDRMVEDKTRDIAATGAGTVAAGDMGCLMNIAGKLARDGSAVEVRHVAEILAGACDGPAVGRGR